MVVACGQWPTFAAGKQPNSVVMALLAEYLRAPYTVPDRPGFLWQLLQLSFGVLRCDPSKTAFSSQVADGAPQGRPIDNSGQRIDSWVISREKPEVPSPPSYLSPEPATAPPVSHIRLMESPATGVRLTLR